MAGTSGKRLAVCSLTSLSVMLLAAAGSARGETLPVQVKVEVRTARGVETRTFRDIQGRVESDGSFSGEIELAGADWSTGAVVSGYLGPPRSPVVAVDVAPRGITPRQLTGTVEATVGIAAGVVTGAVAADFAISVCVDSHVVDGMVVLTPPIEATEVLYGGSIAGGSLSRSGWRSVRSPRTAAFWWGR